MSVERELHALRTATCVTPGDHVACVKLVGTGAADLLERVSPRALFVRTGKMSHTLFLDEAARPLADVYLCCDEDDFFLLAEGMTAAEIITYLRPHAADLDVTFDDLTESHAVLSLGGPYAWELLGELTTPDVIGLPYLGFFHAEAFTCFRGGKTGEYGYDLLVERTRLAAVRAQLADIGARFDLVESTLATQDVAQLEAFFWNARRQSPVGLTPIELQLQWRVNYGRAFPGAAALAERRTTAHQRAVLLASATTLEPGATLRAGDRTIGTVLDAAFSPTRGDWVGMGMVDRAFAHSSLDLASGAAVVHTLSAPSINNRSLHVDPQRHCFATRATDVFPPLVRG